MPKPTPPRPICPDPKEAPAPNRGFSLSEFAIDADFGTHFLSVSCLCRGGASPCAPCGSSAHAPNKLGRVKIIGARVSETVPSFDFQLRPSSAFSNGSPEGETG